MRIDERSTLAQVLTYWKRRQRLTFAQIARAGPISRNTVRLIADGTTLRPGRVTLCMLAVGLAIDPYDGSTDQKVLTRSLAQMAHAVAYDDLMQEWLPATLRTLLTTHLGDARKASAWLALMEHRRDMDVDSIDAIRNAERGGVRRKRAPRRPISGAADDSSRDTCR